MLLQFSCIEVESTVLQIPDGTASAQFVELVEIQVRDQRHLGIRRRLGGDGVMRKGEELREQHEVGVVAGEYIDEVLDLLLEYIERRHLAHFPLRRTDTHPTAACAKQRRLPLVVDIDPLDQGGEGAGCLVLALVLRYQFEDMKVVAELERQDRIAQFLAFDQIDVLRSGHRLGVLCVPRDASAGDDPAQVEILA